MEADSGSPLWLLLVVQVILIALNAIFASAEIAVLSVNESKLEKLEEAGSKRAKRLNRIIEDPAKFLSTIQIAITLSGFLGSAFAADRFSDPLVEFMVEAGVALPVNVLDTLSVIVITLILSYFTLVFGELVPKRIAMKKSEEISLAISGLVVVISRLFSPIVWLLSISTNTILRLFGIDPNEEQDRVSEEEIRLMVEVGGKKGTIDKDEEEFIQRVFEFDDLTAGDIITHRTDVVSLYLEDNDDEWDKIIHESRHTLYPVCDNSLDNIVGILNAKDYFRTEDKTRRNILDEAVSSAYFVPETIKADVLFRNMKQSRNSMAVVLDEHGGMEGIVTFNDLLEELVGEIRDDADIVEEDEVKIDQIDENTWKIKGNAEIEDMEKAMGLVLASENYDTLTGLVFENLEAIPEDGIQDFDVKLPGLNIKVTLISEHQVVEAILTVINEALDTEGDTQRKESGAGS